MQPFDTEARVLEVVAQPLPYYTLALEGPAEWAGARAGQFVMIASRPAEEEALVPYLRRAFSIHDLSRTDRGARIELLAKQVGPGTRALSRRRPGEALAMLGPLGRPFSLPEETGRSGKVALVAGGVGSAPLLLLGRELRAAGVAFDFYYGGRSSIDLARREEFAALAEASGGELVATTEDGSFGRKGLVTEPLAEALAGARYRGLYACGPMGLLARLARLAAEHGVAGEAALETPMGCGFGACLGCAVPLASGRYGLCCKDGPVFSLSAVVW
jgi:dihydroorotate dehydrogenase electron transfer subunit